MKRTSHTEAGNPAIGLTLKSVSLYRAEGEAFRIYLRLVRSLRASGFQCICPARHYKRIEATDVVVIDPPSVFRGIMSNREFIQKLSILFPSGDELSHQCYESFAVN
jgi:hypothetical protein